MYIKFSDFKCFAGEHLVKVAPLTLIYGENSAGKSTLLQLLRIAYTQRPVENLSGYSLEMVAGSSTSGVWTHQNERLLVETEGIGLKGLAPNKNPRKNIRIECSDMNVELFDEGIFFDFFGGIALAGIAAEWQYREWENQEWDEGTGINEPEGDWYPSVIEFDTGSHGFVRGNFQNGFGCNPFEFQSTPYHDVNKVPYFKGQFGDLSPTYDFNPLEIHGLFSAMLDEEKPHAAKSQLFGTEDWTAWWAEENWRGFTRWHEEIFSDYVHAADYLWSEAKSDLTFFTLSATSAQKMLDKLLEEDTKVLLAGSWVVLGNFEPQVSAVIETLLCAFLAPYLPESIAWRTFIPYKVDVSTRYEFPKFAAEFGLEISPLRPPIPDSVPVLEKYNFSSNDPEQYINWIYGTSGKPYGYRRTKTESLMAVNRAFEQLGIPHQLMIRKVADTELRIRFKDIRNSVVTTAQNVGSGVSQLLPIIAACELKYMDSPIMIEQPELHLHPKLQADLGEYLLFNSQGKFNSQIQPDFLYESNETTPLVIETHSELLILRILKLIKEGKASPSDVAINYVANTDDGPLITEIRIGSDGEFIDEWPAGFFEEQSDELF